MRWREPLSMLEIVPCVIVWRQRVRATQSVSRRFSLGSLLEPVLADSRHPSPRRRETTLTEGWIVARLVPGTRYNASTRLQEWTRSAPNRIVGS